jgi:hypothetical protein
VGGNGFSWAFPIGSNNRLETLNRFAFDWPFGWPIAVTDTLKQTGQSLNVFITQTDFGEVVSKFTRRHCAVPLDFAALPQNLTHFGITANHNISQVASSLQVN